MRHICPASARVEPGLGHRITDWVDVACPYNMALVHDLMSRQQAVTRWENVSDDIYEEAKHEAANLQAFELLLRLVDLVFWADPCLHAVVLTEHRTGVCLQCDHFASIIRAFHQDAVCQSVVMLQELWTRNLERRKAAERGGDERKHVFLATIDGRACNQAAVKQS